MDWDMLRWVIGGLATACAFVGVYLNRRISSNQDLIKDNSLDTANIRTDLATLRGHISENYATKADVQNVRADTQHSLDRIHDRIDEIMKSITDMPKTIINLLVKDRD